MTIRIILFLGLLLTSCNSKKEAAIQPTLFKAYVIIPQHGCSFCVNKAMDFMSKNVKNKKLKFIITGINDEKGLILELDKNIVDELYIDSSNEFANIVQSVYPIILYADEKGHLFKTDTASLKNQHVWTKLSSL